jgi:hypothetical protein
MSKEKSKLNPFAGQLRETEEVLWVAARANTVSWQRAVRMGLGIDIVIAVFIVLIMAIYQYLRGYSFGAVMGIFVATLVLCIPVTCVIVFVAVRSIQRTRQTYAVTNERLLYRIEDNVKTTLLEAVTAISLFQGQGAKGTLSFGADFPMWPDVENAAAVKQIIEDAKAQRIQDISA